MLLVLTGLLSAAAFGILVTRIFHPLHRRIALLLYLAGWVPFLISVKQHRDRLNQTVEPIQGMLTGYELHIALLIALIVAGYLIRTLLPDEPSPAEGLSEVELSELLGQDLKLLRYLLDRFDGALDALIGSGLMHPSTAPPSAEDNRRLRDLWAAYIEASFELDMLKYRHRSFHRLPWKSPAQAQAFLISYGAFAVQYGAELTLTRAVSTNDRVVTALNEADPAIDLPPDCYASIQRRLLHPDTLIRLNAGRAWIQVIRTDLSQNAAMLDRVEDALRSVDQAVSSDPLGVLRNPMHYLEKRAFDTWFPVQKEAAVQVSYVRATSRRYFISRQTAAAITDRLRPGDIFFQRREWHLTNLGIPGYWTHAALYLGSPAVIEDFFAGLLELEGGSVADYIAARRPEAWAALQKTDSEGEPLSVIEALRPGVVLHSVAESCSCDSLGVLRPRISRSDLLVAVIEALAHLGKPYDYNFDFTSDNELVCSELIYKAFHVSPDIQLEPEDVNGRLLLSPNQMAIKFDNELGGDTAQLEFVLFLDGRGIDIIEERGIEEFRVAWRRPKWHVLFT
ncbi:MAG: hypothetical protein ACI8RZ_004683 [Myxococcota bacterium]|jgi:hypothetical protein